MRVIVNKLFPSDLNHDLRARKRAYWLANSFSWTWDGGFMDQEVFIK